MYKSNNKTILLHFTPRNKKGKVYFLGNAKTPPLRVQDHSRKSSQVWNIYEICFEFLNREGGIGGKFITVVVREFRGVVTVKEEGMNEDNPSFKLLRCEGE